MAALTWQAHGGPFTVAPTRRPQGGGPNRVAPTRHPQHGPHMVAPTLRPLHCSPYMVAPSPPSGPPWMTELDSQAPMVLLCSDTFPFRRDCFLSSSRILRSAPLSQKTLIWQKARWMGLLLRLL